ncbi:LamG-like jellyroll fold domain-containing protein [Streptosporangium sp. NPDC023963]|uniref:LamG-like jellyroll fold domain-containing protein n=1 Tax=Streptosporangium sp. NPDC023963 TaxID=3155608 RepID=UPI00342D41B2
MDEGTGTVIGDASGQGNTGAATAVTWATAGKYGKALSFNGTSSWVTVPDASSLRLSTATTLSAWVRPTTVTNWRTIVLKEHLAGSGASYGLYASNGIAPSGWFQTNAEDVTRVDGPSALPVNTWNHVAVTYDGTTARLHVNGTQVSQTPVSGALHDDGGVLRIGGNSVWGEYFTGTLDEVRIYNRAQSQTEIQTDMNTAVNTSPPDPDPDPTPTGLVAAYGMDEGTGTVIGDASGQGNTGAATAVTWATAGKYGKALSFNGTSSWVTVPDASSLRLSTATTLSAWVRPTTVTNWRTIVLKEHLAGSGASYGLYASNGIAPSGWFQTNAEDVTRVDGPSALPVNTWNHVAVTYDGTTARLHVNGTQVSQTPVSGALHDDGGVLRIGGNSVWGEYFTGTLDEVRIYNRAQSQTEIQTDMNTAIGEVVAALARRSAPADLRADNATLSAASTSLLAPRDRITPHECFEHQEQADREEGWVKNRFAWCQIGKYTAFRAIPQEPVQYSEINVMLIGATFRNTGTRNVPPQAATGRDIVVDVYVYDVETSGPLPPTKLFLLGMDIGNKPHCNHIQTWQGNPITNHRTKTIADWKLGKSSIVPAFQARLHCDLEHAPTDNGHFMVATKFEHYARYPNWPLIRAYNRGDHAVVRCDSSSDINSDGGCIFNDVLSSVLLKRGQGYDKAYAHYWKACYNSADTYPHSSEATKGLPGCATYSSNKPPPSDSRLHRVREPHQGNNNARAQLRCNSLWPNYTTPGLECDEYPFASTKERSAATDQARRFSVCTIPGTGGDDNGVAGRALNRFYLNERIITGDEYFLRFNTHLDGQNERPAAPTRNQLCGTADPNSEYEH